MKKISFILLSMSFFPMRVFAAETQRMDMKMLKGILVFLRYCSYPILLLAFGMFIFSICEMDGEKKTNSLKVFGISMLLWSLLVLAKASGLCS